MSKHYTFSLTNDYAYSIRSAARSIRMRGVPLWVASQKGSVAFFFRVTVPYGKSVVDSRVAQPTFNWERSKHAEQLLKTPAAMLIRMFVYRADLSLKHIVKLDLPSCTIFENPGVTVATIDHRDDAEHQAQEPHDVDAAYRRGVHEALAKSFADEHATDIEGPDVYAMTDAERLAHEERLYRDGRDAALRAALGLKED